MFWGKTKAQLGRNFPQSERNFPQPSAILKSARFDITKNPDPDPECMYVPAHV